MKTVWAVLLLLLVGHAGAQDGILIEKRLIKSIAKIDYWYEQEYKEPYTNAYDSLEESNQKFERLLLYYTGKYPATITYAFKALSKKGLIIATSEDGNFRVYTWNTLGGGTMRFYKTIFQYKNDKGVFVKASIENRMQEEDPPGSSGCFYYQIHDVCVGDKTYYLTLRKYILANPLSYHSLKVFAISNRGLDEHAKLIRTGKGLQNELGYEIDRSAKANVGNANNADGIEYDPVKMEFTIPVVLENYKVTSKRIRYVFTGAYFERK